MVQPYEWEDDLDDDEDDMRSLASDCLAAAGVYLLLACLIVIIFVFVLATAKAAV